MSTTIQAVLLFQGHAAQLGGGITTLQEVWLSKNLRPDLTATTYLPDIGDSPLSANIINGQSIATNYLSALTCKAISEGEYLEGNARGTIYSVSYDNSLNTGATGEPTQDSDAVILRINGSVSTQSYTPGSNTPATLKFYNATEAKTEAFNSSIPVVYPCVNIDTTQRHRSKTPAEIIALCTDGGLVNASAQWGIPAGCLLYLGASADPIQEVINGTKRINWNVTHRYQARLLEGIADKSWQYVFVKGQWVRVQNNSGTDIDIYTSGTLPDDLA
jgi:hypothetical protein